MRVLQLSRSEGIFILNLHSLSSERSVVKLCANDGLDVACACVCVCFLNFYLLGVDCGQLQLRLPIGVISRRQSLQGEAYWEECGEEYSRE